MADMDTRRRDDSQAPGQIPPGGVSDPLIGGIQSALGSDSPHTVRGALGTLQALVDRTQQLPEDCRELLRKLFVKRAWQHADLELEEIAVANAATAEAIYRRFSGDGSLSLADERIGAGETPQRKAAHIDKGSE